MREAHVGVRTQIGGAVGIAILSTIAVSTTDDGVAEGNALPIALADGFVNAFWTGAAIAFVGVLVSIFLGRGRDLRRRRRRFRSPCSRPPPS
jgi:hypothetical protein